MEPDWGTQFGYMRLVGGRYDQPGLPVTSAAELERYARLVGVVAHHLYLKDHPKRKRVPRGFDNTLDLRLAAVHGGSVSPVLVRPHEVSDNENALLPGRDWHDEARRLINEALSQVATNDRLPGRFPREALKDLVQFGRSLQGNEQIQLGDSRDASERAVLTTTTRRQIQRLAQLDEIEVETVIVGQVTGLTATPAHADIVVTTNGHPRKIDASYSDPATLSVLREYLNLPTDAPLVALEVVAVQGRDDEIIRITDILGAEPSLPAEWIDRLNTVCGVEEGWLSERSEPPSDRVRQYVENILFSCLDSDIDRPSIYPSADGGIQLEWRTEMHTVEVEVLNSGDIEAVAYSLSSPDVEEREFNTASADEVAEFVGEAIRD